MSRPSVVHVFILYDILLSLNSGTFDYNYLDVCILEGSLYGAMGREWVYTEGGKIRRSEYAITQFAIFPLLKYWKARNDSATRCKICLQQL